MHAHTQVVTLAAQSTPWEGQGPGQHLPRSHNSLPCGDFRSWRRGQGNMVVGSERKCFLSKLEAQKLSFTGPCSPG